MQATNPDPAPNDPSRRVTPEPEPGVPPSEPGNPMPEPVVPAPEPLTPPSEPLALFRQS